MKPNSNTTTTDVKKILKRMKAVKPHERAYFIKNEGSIRFCHMQDKKPRYLIFPYGDCDAMTTAAQLLKDCGIVDSYRQVKLSEELFYVELIEYKYKRHTDAKGRVLDLTVPKVKEWDELKLTKSDVQLFIARFELAHPETSPAPRKTPVVQMHAQQQEIKYAIKRIA